MSQDHQDDEPHDLPHEDDPAQERASSDDARQEEVRRVLSKLVGGLQGEAGKVLRAVLERNPVSTDSVEHLLDVLFRVLNRREFLERLLRSEFMRNMRDMQSEFTEAVGIASQADVQALRQQLTEVLTRLDKLQKTLDEIVVEVEER